MLSLSDVDPRLAERRVRSGLSVRRRELRHVTGHLADYGTLLAYIWHQRRTQKHSAG